LNEDIVHGKINEFTIYPIVLQLYKKNNPSKLSNLEFNAWLSGFIDAEGNFQVYFNRQYLQVAFRLTLHKDDIAVLIKIQEYLKIGNVREYGNSCVFIVRNVDDLLNHLIPILDANPLRTVKYLDYLDFKLILNLISNIKSTAVEGKNYKFYKSIIKGMNTGRKSYNIELIPLTIINKYWLLGFIEGEGTFGFKNLVPYFQLAQHLRSSHLMDNILLINLPNLFGFTLKSPKLKPSITINKNTKVLVHSYNNIDSLHDTLAYFLLDLSFQTRKGIDFLYWCLVLHKYGYFYLDQGRKLTVDIANYINTSRYSNSGKIITEPIIDLNLFKKILPVVLTSDMSHLNLAQAFAKFKGPLIIWVYDNKTLIKGSPFNSYADVCEAIGLNRKSGTVKRYIDTVKLYNSRYSFFSSPQK